MKLLLILFLFIIFSCERNNNVTAYRLAKPKETLKINTVKDNLDDKLSFAWNTPSSWMEGKKSSMRLASYSVPFSNGTADLSITNFSGDGGGVLSNVNRWRKQINLPSQSIDEINANALTEKSNLGDYQIYKIINFENEETAFLCSILSIKNSTIFVKMSSTKQGIEELGSQFVDFCSSFRYTK